MSAAAQTALANAARESQARLLAFLASRTRDLAAAEDALADAYLAALETWPHSGIPSKPEAWLLTAARRRLIDVARHATVQTEAAPSLLVAEHEARIAAASDGAFPDERLKLMFICAHPAIDPAARTPLMLQTVLRLDAARIAAAFVVKPSTMGQRLTRAKAKIRDARIPFEVPDVNELAGRLDAVLEAVYAAFGTGWDDVAGSDPRANSLASEAVALGRLVARLLPDEPEALGLLALMLHCEARRDARRTPAGRYVPLAEQDTTRWTGALIDEAEHLLVVAATTRRIGRFQLEAAIQSAHTQRMRNGRTDWDAIATLYEGLVRHAPALGALVGRAAAVAEAHGAAAGWQLLSAIPTAAATSYQPYWALTAHLLACLGRSEEAQRAYRHAADLCEDQATREFLLQRAMS
ncbi:MAG TPA: DUF6596 domain-containing protein [Gemmatimonadaceae bacterium]